MRHSLRNKGLKVTAVLAACVVAAGGVYAQEKKEEEPFWAKGKPKEGAGAKMAPVAAPPIPTPADKLPKLKAPAGFKVEVYQSGVLDARGLRRGDKGTIFVSSLFVAGKIYAITEKGGKREVKTVLSDLELPSGIEFRKGALYVATPKKIMRYDNIEDNLDKAPQPVVIFLRKRSSRARPTGFEPVTFGSRRPTLVP